jgi:hypothetical protein
MEQHRLPDLCTRKDFAEIGKSVVGVRFSHRTIERWPLSVIYVANAAHLRTRDGLAYLLKLVAEAPTIAGGQPPHKPRAGMMA